jgi:beta-lactamase superfamily II metal-dependent hydrolase
MRKRRNYSNVLLITLVLAMLFSTTASAAKKVSISSPTSGEEVNGVLTITGTGSGADTEVSIDGGPWYATSGGKAWSYDWDTTTVPDGPHTITAQYTDGSSSDSVDVTVYNGGSSGPRAPVPGEVLVNEFVAAPSVTEPSEWVELFNTTGENLTIGGMYIDDIVDGGGAPVQIPADTVIDAGGFYVMTFGSYLNNTGDDVRLLGSDGSTVHDSYTYGSASYDMSWCRKPDGGAWSVIECTPTQGSTNDPELPPGSWTEGTLEIHVFNVGQGDSTLIVGPSGKTLLIDVFEASWNTNATATWLASEIRGITGSDHIDYIMASHWHLDHIGYAGYGGIWSLLEEQGMTAGALIDRDGGEWVDSNHDGICDPDLEIVWHNAGTTSGTATNWVCWVDDPNTIGGQIRELAQLGSSTQIDLGISEGVAVTIVQVDADGVMMADGVTPVQGDHTGDALPTSENDYSITIWLNWGKFDFVSGGDTDGEYATSDFGYVYNDVETIVAGRIAQEIEVLSVNHHGSSHSTNQNYVDVLNPDVAIYSVGSTNTYGHPDQSVLDRLYAIGATQYFTQSGDPARDYYDSIIVNDNVVIQVTDGINYTVDGDPYVAEDPSGGPTEPRTPIVGEVVINEFLAAPQTLFTTEWIELYNTTGDQLDIGGMWLDDLIGGGSSPQQIPADTILEPGGYYVFEINSYLNNTGDDVHLLGTDGTTVYDSYTYGSASYDLSICRLPDGGTWTLDCVATKGTSNQ